MDEYSKYLQRRREEEEDKKTGGFEMSSEQVKEFNFKKKGQYLMEYAVYTCAANIFLAILFAPGLGILFFFFLGFISYMNADAQLIKTRKGFIIGLIWIYLVGPFGFVLNRKVYDHPFLPYGKSEDPKVQARIKQHDKEFDIVSGKFILNYIFEYGQSVDQIEE